VVYAGDESSRAAVLWREVQWALGEMVERAHHELEFAEHLLTLFTLTCRTAGANDRERDYVIGLGIPAQFLPTATAAGRSGLVAWEPSEHTTSIAPRSLCSRRRRGCVVVVARHVMARWLARTVMSRSRNLAGSSYWGVCADFSNHTSCLSGAMRVS
jgi:hypothetical protein